MLCALIMAGGKGTRFWPLSTEEKPKQFLNLVGEETMIQMTVRRIEKLIPIDRIFVCTGENYVGLIQEQLPDLPRNNIIIEPEGRNTAPCIALSALVIRRYYKNATMVVLPSDHLIENEVEFRDIIKASREFLNDNTQAIVTLGMKPNRPETGYGYIKAGLERNEVDGYKIIKVDKFVEKPDIEKAKKYLVDGSYLWNGGMFMWKIDNILHQLKKYAPTTYEALHEIENVDENQLQTLINNNYKKTEAISIDYAVLEKSKDIYVVPSDIGWDDIGSWQALERYAEKNETNSIYRGKVTSEMACGNIAITQNNHVIIQGLSDIFVIENDGVIIVGKKDEIDKISAFKNIKH